MSKCEGASRAAAKPRRAPCMPLQIARKHARAHAPRCGASATSDDLKLRDGALQIADDAFTSAGQSDYCGVAEIRVSVRFRRGAAAVNDAGECRLPTPGGRGEKWREDRGSGLALEGLIPAGDAVSKRLFG